MLAFHLGMSVVGLRVRDGRCLIDYLETRADMNAKSLGAMGISGGGMHTFFSTCFDRRIKACQRSVKKAVATAREVYRVFGAESEMEVDFFEGRHQISGRRAYDFLREKLSS